MAISSPLTNKRQITLLSSIPAQKIVESYQESLQIDVSRFFKNVENVELYQDEQTGYRFFYPWDIDGDGNFYKDLQKFDWYYMPWKWEHEISTQFLKEGMKILEVGCAYGSFIQKASVDFGVSAIGLELNKIASEEGRKSGLNILNEGIEVHASKNNGTYDLVCSFQVLEHITSVHSFIEAKIDCLKPGGKLLIGVPNNDSFLGLDSWNILNIPPHHMGLWNEEALKNLESIFPIKFCNSYFEPLQDYHKGYYNSVLTKYLGEKENHNLLQKVMKKIKRKADVSLLKQKYPTLKNFTILVEFEKR